MISRKYQILAVDLNINFYVENFPANLHRSLRLPKNGVPVHQLLLNQLQLPQAVPSSWSIPKRYPQFHSSPTGISVASSTCSVAHLNFQTFPSLFPKRFRPAKLPDLCQNFIFIRIVVCCCRKKFWDRLGYYPRFRHIARVTWQQNRNLMTPMSFLNAHFSDRLAYLVPTYRRKACAEMTPKFWTIPTLESHIENRSTRSIWL